ncbi:ectin-like isoform X2 [Oculina patagonica]
MLKIFFVLMFFFLCEGKPRLATCPGGGGDKRSSCGRWKKLGYCDPKKGSWRFMAASCPASCGLCQGLEKVNITECLQAHNSKRALHGAAPLTWDTSLARKAEAWASYLTTRNLFEHAPWSVRLAGENLNLRIKLGKTATCKDAVESWYLEWKDYPFQNPPNSVQDTEAPIGHFTQVGYGCVEVY